MKCLSIRQPWASMIVSGIKDVENRTWYSNYTGDLLIHSSKTIDKKAYNYFIGKFPNLKKYFLVNITGAIIGRAKLVQCTRFDMMRQPSIWHEEDMYGWYFEDPVLFSIPIICKGKLGLFNVEGKF